MTIQELMLIYEFYKGDFDNPNTEEVFLLHHKTVDITPPS